MAFESILWKVVVMLLAGGLAWDYGVVTPETDSVVYRTQDGSGTMPPPGP